MLGESCGEVNTSHSSRGQVVGLAVDARGEEVSGRNECEELPPGVFDSE